MADAPAPSDQPNGQPTVATTITLPPSLPVDANAGGEWELLVSKLRDWFAGGEAAILWSRVRTPLVALAALIALLMVLRVYGALIDALESIPLLPGLLELVGVIWMLRFGAPRLVRSSDRQALLDGLRSRWQAFQDR